MQHASKKITGLIIQKTYDDGNQQQELCDGQYKIIAHTLSDPDKKEQENDDRYQPFGLQ
jgi:hypothetical protein